jgi:hypothetical protein
VSTVPQNGLKNGAATRSLLPGVPSSFAIPSSFFFLFFFCLSPSNPPARMLTSYIIPHGTQSTEYGINPPIAPIVRPRSRKQRLTSASLLVFRSFRDLAPGNQIECQDIFWFLIHLMSLSSNLSPSANVVLSSNITFVPPLLQTGALKSKAVQRKKLRALAYYEASCSRDFADLPSSHLDKCTNAAGILTLQ